MKLRDNMVLIEGIKARIEILKGMFDVGNLPKMDYVSQMHRLNSELIEIMESERRRLET